MANWKSLTDDQLWWKSQPGNRGKSVPRPQEATAAYQKYGRQANKNVDTVRNFLFGASDKRKQAVEDAVNARRDRGESIPIQKFYPTDKSGNVQMGFNPDERKALSEQDAIPLYQDESIAAGQTVKKGGRIKSHAKGGSINLKDCKISTHVKSKKQSNW